MSSRSPPVRKRISSSRPNSPKTKPSPTNGHGPSPGRFALNNFVQVGKPTHRVTHSYGSQTAHLSLVTDKIEKLLKAAATKKRPTTRASGDRPPKASAKATSPYHASEVRTLSDTQKIAAYKHKRAVSLTSNRPTTSLPSSRLDPEPTHKRKFSVERGDAPLPVVAKFAHRSQVGYLPGNPNKVNQDNFIESVNFAGKTNSYLFAVADGHGFYGHEVSYYIKTRLPVLLSQESTIFTAPKKAISAAVIRCNAELNSAPFDVNFSGSTLTLALIDNHKLWCGNVGDSRTLIVRQLPESKDTPAGPPGLRWMAIALSRDHKPDEEDEAHRITAAGGRIESYQDEEGNPLGPPRVWLKHQDIPGLAMSRSLGDGVAASVGVSCEPEIIEFSITKEDKFLVIGSDGIYEFISNEDVVRIVVPFWKTNDPVGACEALSREAHNRWTTEEEVIDDITCVVVFLDAEIVTTLAEKEVQQWQRSRSGSRTSSANVLRSSHTHSDSGTARRLETPLSTASSPRVLDSLPLPFSFTPRTTSSFQYIPKRDYDKALQEKTREIIQQLDDQRKDLTESFAKRMRENEENIRGMYQEKIEVLEEKLRNCSEGTVRELRNRLSAAGVGEEARRRELEGQLREEREKGSRSQEETRRLERLLTQKSDEISSLHKELDKLLLKIREDESQIRRLSDLATSQNLEISSLVSKTQNMEGDYASLAKELNEAKLRNRREVDGALKTRVRELEQENQLLKRDYEALSSLHKRTLQEAKLLQDTEETSPNSLFGFIRKNYDMDEAEQRAIDQEMYEKRCLELTEEAIQWKEKTLLIATKHHQELQALRSEHELLREEMERLCAQVGREIEDVWRKLQHKTGAGRDEGAQGSRQGEGI